MCRVWRRSQAHSLIGLFCGLWKQGCELERKGSENRRDPEDKSNGDKGGTLTVLNPEQDARTQAKKGVNYSGTEVLGHELKHAYNTQNRIDLASGTYALTVTDALGCISVLNNIIVKDNCPNANTCTPPVIGGVTIADATCNQINGQITVTEIGRAHV